MFVTNAAPTVYFDIDSTLVFTSLEVPAYSQKRCIAIRGRTFWVHETHVEHIKDFWARGHNVIVWSQGAAEWAAAVVIALDLESYVTACISKPMWYFDDKRSGDWLRDHQRSYIEA